MILYEINKDKRVVIARFEGGQEEMATSLGRMCLNILSSTYISNSLAWQIVDNILISYPKFIGKAVCHEDDEWDEEKGKALAKERLLQKWYKIKSEVLERLEDYVIQNYKWTLERVQKRRKLNGICKSNKEQN